MWLEESCILPVNARNAHAWLVSRKRSFCNWEIILAKNGFPSHRLFPKRLIWRHRDRSRPAIIRNMQKENQTDEDRILLRLIAAGDEAAFAQYYDRIGDALYGLACRLLGDTKEAEDLMQDVFVQIWRKAAQYDSGKGSPFAWSVTILRTRAIDRLRRRYRKDALILRVNPGKEAEEALDERSAQEPWLRERRLRLRSALLALPDEQREAIELAFFDDLSHQAIAERLAQPLGTIKARIRRGLLRLRDQLRGGL
jgi:RNA polymerase sigma-70 factor, ECF subfamily